MVGYHSKAPSQFAHSYAEPEYDSSDYDTAVVARVRLKRSSTMRAVAQ